MTERFEGGATGGRGAPVAPTFFEAMAWPVPIAFAGAIAAMRFEQGDVLYRDPRAYDVLEGKIPDGLSAIQVLLPKRSARATASDFEGDRRQASWQSEVTIELIDLARGKTETRVLSQGKLAMAIFRGDDDWLDPERETPPMPRSARALQQRLDETLASFDARQTVGRGCRFVFAVDVASDASRTKAADVEEGLRASGAIERIELSAEDAGIADAETYHPTAVVRCLVMPGRTTEEVLPILRERLYARGSASMGDLDKSDSADSADHSDGADESGKDETTPDRFSVGRHGILQAIPVES